MGVGLLATRIVKNNKVKLSVEVEKKGPRLEE
jgi:hypothetical protein